MIRTLCWRDGKARTRAEEEPSLSDSHADVVTFTGMVGHTLSPLVIIQQTNGSTFALRLFAVRANGQNANGHQTDGQKYD